LLAYHRGSPGLVMQDLWWTKWRWGRVSLSTSISPANSRSTNCSTIINYHLQLVQQVGSGCSTKCIQSHPTNNNNNNNNNNCYYSIKSFIIYVPSQQLQGQLQTQHSVDTGNYIMVKQHKVKEKLQASTVGKTHNSE
jgi:hypothetical protein